MEREQRLVEGSRKAFALLVEGVSMVNKSKYIKFDYYRRSERGREDLQNCIKRSTTAIIKE